MLELLVAFVIMAFSLGMLYQASGGTVRNLGEVESHQRAVILARSILNARDAVPELGWNERGESAGFVWHVSSAPFLGGITDPRVPALQEIQIAVEWADRRGARRLELKTLLPQLAPIPGTAR
ncbi:MAG: hypothetical protein ABI919_03375 [Ramlibacter sp.]